MKLRILYSCCVALAFGLQACSPWYIVKASYYQAKLLAAREPIEELLSSRADLTEQTKNRLSLTLEIRDFAPTVGLEVKDQFSDFSNEKLPTVWVLSATPALSLDRHFWWFPIVGHVPYKGFYSKDDAIDESKFLVSKGNDISIRTTAAYSTLGWFNDPVTVSLVSLDKEAFIDTIFHELIHTNIWIPGSASFNETLANIVGHFAALRFAKEKYPDLVPPLKNRLIKDCEMARNIESTTKELRQLFDSDLAKEQKLLQKAEIYQNLNKELHKIIIDNKFGKPKLAVQVGDSNTGATPPPPTTYIENNAAFLALQTYLDGYLLFARAIIHLGSESELLLKLKQDKKNSDDPFEWLSKNILANYVVEDISQNTCAMLKEHLNDSD